MALPRLDWIFCIVRDFGKQAVTSSKDSREAKKQEAAEAGIEMTSVENQSAMMAKNFSFLPHRLVTQGDGAFLAFLSQTATAGTQQKPLVAGQPVPEVISPIKAAVTDEAAVSEVVGQSDIPDVSVLFPAPPAAQIPATDGQARDTAQAAAPLLVSDPSDDKGRATIMTSQDAVAVPAVNSEGMPQFEWDMQPQEIFATGAEARLLPVDPAKQDAGHDPVTPTDFQPGTAEKDGVPIATVAVPSPAEAVPMTGVQTASEPTVATVTTSAATALPFVPSGPVAPISAPISAQAMDMQSRLEMAAVPIQLPLQKPSNVNAIEPPKPVAVADHDLRQSALPISEFKGQIARATPQSSTPLPVQAPVEDRVQVPKRPPVPAKVQQTVPQGKVLPNTAMSDLGTSTPDVRLPESPPTVPQNLVPRAEMSGQNTVEGRVYLQAVFPEAAEDAKLLLKPKMKSPPSLEQAAPQAMPTIADSVVIGESGPALQDRPRRFDPVPAVRPIAVMMLARDIPVFPAWPENRVTPVPVMSGAAEHVPVAGSAVPLPARPLSSEPTPPLPIVQTAVDTDGQTTMRAEVSGASKSPLPPDPDASGNVAFPIRIEPSARQAPLALPFAQAPIHMSQRPMPEATQEWAPVLQAHPVPDVARLSPDALVSSQLALAYREAEARAAIFRQVPFSAAPQMPVVVTDMGATPRSMPTSPALNGNPPVPVHPTAAAQIMVPAMPATAPIAPPVALPGLIAQIKDHSKAGKPGQVELALSPEELGKVRLYFTPDGDKMRIVIQAERPETLDMLRRNTEAFHAEMRQSGFSGTTFSFGGWGDGPQENTHKKQNDVSGFAADTQQMPAPQIRQAGKGSGLDLRV